MVRAIVNRQKHEVTGTFLNTDMTLVNGVTLYTGTASADLNAGNEVGIGSKVFSVYIEFNVSAAETSTPNVFHWQLIYLPAPASATPPIPSLYNQNIKSHILKRGMEMIPVNVSTVIKRIFVVRIPKKYQRTETGAILSFRQIASPGTDNVNFCFFAIFQEYK